MSNENKIKYVGITGLSKFLEFIEDIFAPVEHDHNQLYFTQEEITTKIDEVKSGIPLIQFVTWGDDD